MSRNKPQKVRLPISKEATFTSSRFRIIIPHPGDPEPQPDIREIPQCLAKYEGTLGKCNKICTRMRKMTSLANNFEKECLERKVHTLCKEHTFIINRHNSELQPLQKSLEELRGCQTVLEKRNHAKYYAREAAVTAAASVVGVESSGFPVVLPAVKSPSRRLPGMPRRQIAEPEASGLIRMEVNKEGDPPRDEDLSRIGFRQNSESTRMRKKKVSLSDSSVELSPFGRYGGVAISELREDIKRLVEQNHPRAKRIRHAHKLMEVTRKMGPLANPELLAERLNDICTRPWAEFLLIDKSEQTTVIHEATSQITTGGPCGPAMVEQTSKGYGNFFTSANQAFIFN